MSNKEKFDFFVKHDLSKVNAMYSDGYTETSEWKNGLELLMSSLEALLQDMDMGGADER